MTDRERKALLPAGLQDVLPPRAAQEAEVVERLIAHFAANGYDRVKAPLIEFEDSLLSGAGAAMTAETFRLMDPLSQRMMGFRSDITPQIARIAATRLGGVPRPLRLCYAGEVLRVTGTQLRPERQFAQVGMELIGSDAARADAELVVLAAEALAAVGVADITVDLTLPPLVPALCAANGLVLARDRGLREALDHKDTAAIAARAGPLAGILCDVLAACGTAERCLDSLRGLALPDAAARERERLAMVVAEIRAAAPDLALTADPVENRGFEYHTGICFTIFPRDVRGELASGGRYLAGTNGMDDAAAEPATGITHYVDTILRVLAEPGAGQRVYLPVGTAPEIGRALRAEGWVTLAGLTEADPGSEAVRLGCTHLFAAGRVGPVPMTGCADE